MPAVPLSVPTFVSDMINPEPPPQTVLPERIADGETAADQALVQLGAERIRPQFFP